MAAIAATRVAESPGAGGFTRGLLTNGQRQIKMVQCTVVGGTGYATGGVDLSSFLEGMQEVKQGFVNVRNGARLASFDPATKKVLIFTAIGTEAANASDQTAAGTIDVAVFGR